MNCPSCQSGNRPGALRCKRCGHDLPRSCAGCGEAIQPGIELCINCRTERVPAALGAEIELEDAALLESAPEEPVEPAFPIAPVFVGRRSLLERLAWTVDEAVRTRELAFVSLTGAPGMGKTRLCEELVHFLRGRHSQLLCLTSSGRGAQSSPFSAFERLLGERFGFVPGEDAAESRRKVVAGVTEVLPASRVTEVSHLVAHLAGVPFPDSPVLEPLSETPAQLEMRLFIALRRLLHAEGEKRPILVVLDEIERATPETVNLLHYLAAGLRDVPVVILAVGEPNLFELHPTFGEGDVPLERLELGALDGSETAEMLSELVKPVSGQIPEMLLEHARGRLTGTPRAVVELVRYLLEVGVISPVSRGSDVYWRWDAELLRGVSLPVELESIIAERLRVLPAAERDLLEKASACGEVFWVDCVVALVRAVALERGDPDGPTLGEVAAAGDATRVEVETALRRMERHGLVVGAAVSSIPGEREYRFAYPPWWELVYEGVDTAARRRYHRLLAQWLELRPEGRGEEEQEEIGRHLERAGDGQGAAVWYRRAADGARARYYNDKAVRLYVGALGCLGPGDLATRILLWHDLGSVFQLKGDFDHALNAFERMLRLAWVMASRTKAAVAFNKMGRIHRQKGDLPIALEYLERGRELFEQAGDVRGIAGSLDDIGQVLWLLSRYDEALDRSAAALETRRQLGDRRSIALSLMTIGHIERHRGLFDEAGSCYEEALELRRALEDRAGIAEALNGLGVLAFQRGDIEGGRARWQEALEIAESVGAMPLQALLLDHLGEAARELGQLTEARTRFEEAETIARDIDDKRLQSESLRNLGMLDLQSGDTARALERCKQALVIATAAGIRVDIGRALVALGEVEGATLFDASGGQEGRAREYFGRGVTLFREIRNDAELGLALESFGRYCVEHGDVSEGKKMLTEAQQIFSRLGMRAGDHIRRVIGEL